MVSSSTPPDKDLFLSELKRLEGLFESSTLNYQSLDTRGNIIKVNSSWLKTLGYTAKDITDRWFGEFLTPDSRKRFEKHYRELQKEKKNENLELTLLCKDGSKIYTEFTCIASYTTRSKIFYSHCIFQNITRLRKVEQALQESEWKYSQLVELSYLGIFEYQVNERKYTYVNNIIKRVLGLPLNTEEIPNLANYLTPDSLLEFSKRIKQLQQGQSIPNTVEYRMVNARGETIWVELSNSYIQEEKGIRIIGVAKDITARKKLETKLIEYHKRLEQLTHNLPAVLFQYQVVDGKTEFLYISENIEHLTGCSSKEVIADPGKVTGLIELRDFEEITRSIAASSKKGIPATLDFQVTIRDGEKRWIKTILSPNRIDSKVTLWTGVSSDITEEVRTKQKLHETEVRFRTLVNSAAPGISTMSRTGIIESVNPRLCEISGYKEEELVGKHFLKIPAFFIKDAPKYLKLYNNALKGIIPACPVPFEWKHKSGEKRYGEGFLSTISEGDKVSGYQAVLTDVTDRKRLEQNEEQRKKEIAILFEAAVQLLNIEYEKELYQFLAGQLAKLNPGSYVVLNSIDEDQKVLTVESVRIPGKATFGKIYNLLEKNLEGRQFQITPNTFNYAIAGRLKTYHQDLYDLALHQIPEGICNQIEKLIKLGTILEISLGTPRKILGGCAILLKKGQEIRHAGIIETLFREASGALVRLRTKKRLDNSEKLYRSLAESTDEWIMRFSIQYKLLYANQAVFKALKETPERLTDKQCRDIPYLNEFSEIIESRISVAYSTGRPTQCEIELHLDGVSRFYDWRFYPEVKHAPDLGSILVYARDITRRKETEGKLLDTISKKNKLYSIISHDMRTPFNSIIGFTGILKEKYQILSDENRLKYINIVDDASQNCLSLFESILHWSKENIENESMNPSYFDLGLLIKKGLSLYHASLLQKELKVKTDFSENLIVHAEYNMVSTVLRNLISNAINYSGPGDQIMISLMEEKEMVRCKVQDSGPGMDQELIDTIVGSKKTAYSKVNTRSTGSGLGLKLSREFVEFNNGRFWIESEPGKGTSVFFTLPMRG